MSKAIASSAKGGAMTDDEFVEITEALRESEARLEAVLSSLDDLVFELDESGTYLGIWTANDALLAAPRHELLGRMPAEVLGEEIGLRLKEITKTVLETGRPQIWEYGLEVPAGVRWFQSRVAPIVGPDGRSTRICLLVRDITEQKEAELEIARLLSREQLLTRLSEALPVGLFEIDLSGRITFANAQVHKISGQPGAETVESLMAAVVAEDLLMLRSGLDAVFANQAVDALEMTLRFSQDNSVPSASERICDMSLRALTDESGAVIGAVGCLSDVTDSIQLRRELELRASTDKLTACLNREASLELLERTIAAPPRTGSGNALIFIDVDRLKTVNDRFGHAAGDCLLDTIGRRLLTSARRGDAVGRVGGDEFIVICPGVPSPAQALRIAERAAAATTGALKIGEAVIELRTSVGVAWTDKPLDGDSFLAQADAAMYRSKSASSNKVTLFDLARRGRSQAGSSPRVRPRMPARAPLLGGKS
jgi:diguanylate cyclase (GGDEF)-like protein/PAS domain S-box-containing protein